MLEAHLRVLSMIIVRVGIMVVAATGKSQSSREPTAAITLNELLRIIILRDNVPRLYKRPFIY
jgi:hypothetical protein